MLGKKRDGRDDTLSEADFTRSQEDLLRHTRLSRAIYKGVAAIGDVFSWFWFVLMGVIILNVILRYVFHQGMIELEELQWYLYAAAWLIGLSYTFVFDGHVRVDVFHDQISLKLRLWLEIFGLVVLFLPFVCFVLYYGYPFFELSWTTNERSTSANGLPARWLIKGCLIFAFALLLAIGLARLLQVIATLRFGPEQPGGCA